jgi:hypothetical protein
MNISYVGIYNYSHSIMYNIVHNNELKILFFERF